MNVLHTELSRLEAEDHSRQVEMEEIRNALLEKGDIQKFWDEKLMEERSRYLEVERYYQEVVHNLNQGNIDNEKSLAEHLKEKAAIDCQKQLLISLREEVDEMLERLAFERATYMSEHLNVQNALSDLQNEVEEKLDKKSILQAEIEALRILRYFVVIFIICHFHFLVSLVPVWNYAIILGNVWTLRLVEIVISSSAIFYLVLLRNTFSSSNASASPRCAEFLFFIFYFC